MTNNIKKENNNVIKVSSKSPVQQTSGCLIKSFGQKNYANTVEMRAIGASSVNQMLKATAIARGVLASKGYDLILRPSFDGGLIEGEQRTVFVVRASLLKQ